MEIRNRFLFFSNNQEKAKEKRKLELLNLEKWYALNHAHSVFDEFLYIQKRNEKLQIFKDVALAAHCIDNILTQKGMAPVLFLGRTPCFIQIAYEELFKLKYPDLDLATHSIHLSFSMTPDAITVRSSTRYQNYNILRNMVTPKKLAFYEKYLTKKKLDKVKDKLFVVDAMGTGGGLNSFLRLLRHYYRFY